MGIASGAGKAGGSVGGAAGGAGGNAGIGGGGSGNSKFKVGEWEALSDEAWRAKKSKFSFGTIGKTALGVSLMTGGAVPAPLALLVGVGKAVYDYATANPANWNDPKTQATFGQVDAAGGGQNAGGVRKPEPVPAMPGPVEEAAPGPETLGGSTPPAPAPPEEKLSGRPTKSRVNPLTRFTGVFGVESEAKVLRRTLGGSL